MAAFVSAGLIASCGGTVAHLAAPTLSDDIAFELPFAVEDAVLSTDRPAVQHLVDVVGISERQAACVVRVAGTDLPPHDFAALRFANMFTVSRSALADAFGQCTPSTVIAAGIAADGDIEACIVDTAEEASAGAFLAAVAAGTAGDPTSSWPNRMPEAAICLASPTNEPESGDESETTGPDDGGGFVLDLDGLIPTSTPTEADAAETDDDAATAAADRTAGDATLPQTLAAGAVTPAADPGVGLALGPDARLALLLADTDELAFTPLGPGDGGYEVVRQGIAAGRAMAAADVSLGDSTTTAATVWVIAWDPDVPGDALFAKEWLAWARGDNTVRYESIDDRLVERLYHPTSPLSYVLESNRDTAMLIADIGGGDALVARLVALLD